MDSRSLTFDIQRTDNADFLNLLREEVEGDAFCSAEDKAEVLRAIDARFSQLNLLALEKKNTEGKL